jgi:superfamily II DNA or RNA helicase
MASTGIFSEGMSVNNLSLLIHLSSTNNESLLSQLAGRIMRIHPNKNSPIIIDLLLSGVTGITHWKSRKAFYESRGWKIKHAASYSDLDRFL